MNTEVEELVREAQLHMADRAPDPEPIRAALATGVARRARVRRTGLLVAAAAAAATVVTLTVPMVAFRTPAADPPAGPPPAPAAVEFAPVALGFHPTRLPAGLAERGRLLVLPEGTEPGLHRTWTAAADADPLDRRARLELGVRRTGEPLSTADGTPVDVGGREGVHHGADSKSYLAWRYDDATVLTLSEHGLGLSRPEMVAIARSVRPEPGTFSVPVRLGVLPDAIAVETAEIAGASPRSWSVLISGSELPAAGPSRGGKERAQVTFLSVTYATSAPAPAPADGRPVTVAGHPARWSAEKDGQAVLIVDLGGGRRLTLTASGVTEAEMIRVAGAVRVDDTPDVRWLGTP
ncbi:hypothetical protein [Jidongwangia harbinensis]|uniref:hypothetical protein n=1 Tax=Jidongwangia harbinensis TaxID=2878561 RepID=UPI001CD91F8D|nr:hypothetical protein [Jidongwangia harbinensis]MCA2215033.1 hypothetical protein [Jidongwangia harbinensis]